jgi:electron transfer flavoprotein alpha subunit
MAETILVVAEQREGRLNRVSLETVVAAQTLATQTGWAVEAAVVGGVDVGEGASSPAAELARCAVATVYAIEGAQLASYTPDGFVAALRAFIERRRPKLVLLPHTYQVRDFAPRLAASFGAALLSDVVGCRFDSGKLVLTRPMFQGKFAADLTPAGPDVTGDAPCFASLQSGAFRADAVESGSAPIEHVTAAAGEIRTRPEPPFREARQMVDLTQAELIVSVGRGIREQKNIAMAQALAEALGAELAASRPICDAGWLPMDRQVGSSGQTVNPKLYLALGISGAIQHLVGMKGSRNIIAVNKDAEAPIFEIADVAVVGDLFEVVPALVEEIRKARG